MLCDVLEITNILLSWFVIQTFISGLFFGPAMIYTKLDPFFAINQVFGISFPAGVRLVSVQFVCMEAARSYSISLLPLMRIFKVYFSILSSIYNLPVTSYSIVKYTRLQCIAKCGDDAFKLIAGVSMTAGFGICVVGLWAVIQGWKIFPIPLYLVICGVVFSTYTIVFSMLPAIAQVQKSSEHFLQVHLKRQAFRKSLVWRKQLRAQQPICFHYMLACFDESTETNFYDNNVNTTVNISLMF